MTEYWTAVADAAHRYGARAAKVETDGWDGITMVDSQNLAQDSYVCLAMAAQATENLGLMTSVTNTVTRAPAVTASSALTIQSLSRGRMVLGIGRGDSALAHLGRAPARLKWFERYLKSLQAYLRGEEVSFEETLLVSEMAPPVDTLGLADSPDASSIAWAARVPKVPVEVASSGEKVIGISARHADRVMFALGADVARLKWGIKTATRAAEAEGRDPASLMFGAYVNVVCHDDLELARSLGRGATSLFARFSSMYGKVSGPTTEVQRDVFQNVHDRYDMNKHAQSDGSQTTALTDEFMDSYAIIGSVDHCVSRLQELQALGITKFCVAGAGGSGAGGEAAANFTGEVLPRLRAA